MLFHIFYAFGYPSKDNFSPKLSIQIRIRAGRKSLTLYLLPFTIIAFLSFFPLKSEAKGGIGPGSSYYLVHDYQDDWQVFDSRYKAYVPYVREQHNDYNSFSLFFDIENYKGYKLLYRSERENYLFIDATLQKKLPTTSWVVLDIDSLQQAFGKTLASDVYAKVNVPSFAQSGMDGYAFAYESVSLSVNRRE